MKITSIKQQLKNPERASIFIDGKYAFSLSLSELVEAKLKINSEINEQQLKKLKKISEDGKLRNRAMEWTLNRPRSIREFKDYLYRKKADPDLILKLQSEFEDKKYLDEDKFANWLTDLRRRAGKSERAIRSELTSKGISRDVITQVLSKDGDEEERLKALIQKKSKLSRYKADPDKFKQYLMRQGFKYEDIKRVLES